MEFGLYVKREKTRKGVDIWYTQWVYCFVVCLYYGDMICLAYVHVCTFCHGFCFVHSLSLAYLHAKHTQTHTESPVPLCALPCTIRTQAFCYSLSHLFFNSLSCRVRFCPHLHGATFSFFHTCRFSPVSL